MKNKFLLLGIAATLFISSCTKKFDDINKDPINPDINDPALAAGAANALFSSAVGRGLMRAGEFQRVQALYVDLYAQYFGTSAVYFASDRYQINQGWLDFGWNLFYPRDIKNLVDILKSSATNNQKQIARIWKVFLYHRMVDFYGDIPYFNAGDPNKPEVFDNQKLIYLDMFKELKEAVTAIDASGSYDAKDLIYAGDINKWKKFANTLRLRLALHVTKADPALAKAEGEAAILGGLFTSNADNAIAKVSAAEPNALNQITGFNEFRMSASMESVLNGYNDPRVAEYFSPVSAATGGVAPFIGTYSGIRNGTAVADLGLADNTNGNNSNMGVKFLGANAATNPRIVLTYAEACFLLSEAAWRGWTIGAGTTKAWYENGIAASMNQFGITNAAAITAYTNNATPNSNIPFACTRPITTLPVLFSATTADQLEQIIVQKWLATYPDGFEAWATFRRTDLPKLYPVQNIDPSSNVTPGNFIQRLQYTDNMKSINPAGVAAAEARMGGGGQATKLWIAGGL
jgi:hypothetical protein